jgi:hypothetical protein
VEEASAPFDPLRVVLRAGPDDNSRLGNQFSSDPPSDPGISYWLENLPRLREPQPRSLRNFSPPPPHVAHQVKRILTGHGVGRYCQAIDLVFDTGNNLQGVNMARNAKWCAEQIQCLLRKLVSNIEKDEDIVTVKDWIGRSSDSSRARLMQVFSSEMGLHLGPDILDSATDLIILALKKALDLTPVEAALRAEYLGELASVYSSRFQQQGRLEDFSTAMKHAQAAVKLGFVSSAIKREPRWLSP